MSSHVRMVNPPALHPAPGFSHIAIAPVSEIAYIAGQTALAPDFSVIGLGDLKEQTRASMKKTSKQRSTRSVPVGKTSSGARFTPLNLRSSRQSPQRSRRSRARRVTPPKPSWVSLDWRSKAYSLKSR